MYKSKLDIMQTERMVKFLKTVFEAELSSALNLSRISAPLFVTKESGLNDNLNGVERPVSFDVKATGKVVEVVHSLAKWKRYALAKYGFERGSGLYTDMNAIRRDEDMDNLHSIYVDQWDWEVVIGKEDRNVAFLQSAVRKIYRAIKNTCAKVREQFPVLSDFLPKDITFVTSQELEDRYPSLTPKQRETEFVKSCGAAFVMGIGAPLKSGKKHDGRAPDYDDWSLNGDIMFWNELHGCAFEVASMGIRVDAESLDSQLAEAGAEDRKRFLFHRLLLDGTLPLTMGGGIGQSRLCMLLLQKAHIGEVQCSIWDDVTRAKCDKAGIALL